MTALNIKMEQSMIRLEQIMDSLKVEENLARRMYFNKDFSLHRVMRDYLDTVVGNVAKGESNPSVALEELSEFYLMLGLYGIVFNADRKRICTILSSAACYSHTLLTHFNKECKRSQHTFIVMRKAVYLWSSLFLVKWKKPAFQAGDALIDSLNKSGSIIGYGSRLYPESWFLIDAYGNLFAKKYDSTYADLPKNMDPYNKILDALESDDMLEVEKQVAILCEAHLCIDDDPDEPEFEYLNFSKAIMKLYPYAAISYLAMRSFKGLRCPTEFSHPLMNTPIAKFFLSHSMPIPETNLESLPYGKILVEKLKEEC